MKGHDLQTLEILLSEYGMKPGVSTSVGDQQSGQQAKQNKAKSVTAPSKSNITKPSPSPTVLGSKPKSEEEPVEPTMAIAKDVKKGSQTKDDQGQELEIIGSVGNKSNPDTIVAKNKKGEYVTVEPDSELEVTESASDRFEKIAKRKNRLKRKIKHLLRAQKHAAQGELVFEINFNSKELAKGALSANIQCGFEAETVWPDLGEGGDPEDTDWLDDLYWSRVSDLIYDQEGARALERVEQGYGEWLQEEEIVFEYENEIVRELINDRKEDETYIDNFVSDQIDMDDVAEYKANKLEKLEIDDMEDELEEYSDWDMDAWAREYVEMHKEDELVEWLEEDIRDNGEAWDDAWQRAQEEHDMDDWCRREHGGSWWSLLSDYDIYLYNEDAEGGGVDAVASILEDWASNNSKTNDVRPGGYHSGSGVDNSYWRVEDDSSIEGDGAKAEIISPVYDSPAEMLKEMKSLFEFMDNNDVETNTSTGLHVTMSWMEKDWAPTNKLKMAVLLGDKYVLKQFGREFNSYTKSQQETLQQYIKNLQNDIKDEKSLAGLEDILLGGISDGKFSSINFKDARNVEQNNLIEFRVAGGDDYHLMSDKVMKAVIRYAAVMQAGHDEEAYRKDYVKALFKMISGKDTVSGDVVKRAQTMVDPASINDKVLAAFQAVSSEKHYTDSIEALSNAYMELADAMSAKNADPQQELQFEDEGDEVDWRRTLIKAQKYFVRAFSMLASDVASGVNRAKPTAAVVSSLRQALKDFSLTPKTLWAELQQSEFVKNFPGDHHVKMEKIANAVNSLLKKQDAKAPEAAYSVTVPKDHILLIPNELADSLFGDIFGGTKPDETATISQKDFKIVSKDDYEKVKSARYEMEYNEQYIKNEQEMIDGMTASIKTQSDDTQRVEQLKDAIKSRQEKIAGWQKENVEYKATVDAFVKKYGFAPKSVRSGSEPIGPDHRIMHDDARKQLSQRFNIRFDVQESAFDRFDKLPLAEQLNIISKVDKRKLDEAWSKKYKNSIDCNNPKGFSQKAHCAGKKKKNETIEAEQDIAALLTSYGTPKKKKKKAKGFEHPNKSGNKVKEGAVPVHNTKRDYNAIMNKPLLGSDIKAQMQAYFVVPDPSMVREFRAQIAMAGKNVDLRPVFKAFADRQLHPKEKKQVSESVIAESRGVTARQPGEQYISDSNPQDILTIQSIDIFPNDGNPAYDSVEQLQSVLDKAVPDNGMRIDDNNPTAGSKAAIVATVSTEQGDDQYWVRFIKSIPPSGVDNLWKTLRGYKYSKGASRESIPVKPSDMVTPNAYITTDQIASDVDHNATTKFAGTEHDALVAVLNDAVSKARSNDTSPIDNASKYFNVLQKYAGEYLGPLSLIDGGNLKGDTAKMLEAYGLTTLAGSTIMFPDDTAYPLVDSIIRTPDGKEIGISSKAHTGGGATSSLSGVVNQLTPEIEQRYPRGTAIMKLLGTSPTKLGPVLAARQLGVLTDQDVEDFKTVPLDSKDLKSITNQTLYNIAANQGVQDEAHPNYRVFFRLLAGIVNIIIPMINSDQEFIDAMKETLNNNNFIQVLQKGKKVGDGVSMDYYTKYPAVFEGAPKLVNKGYAATMAKDRLGFKLKK